MHGRPPTMRSECDSSTTASAQPRPPRFSYSRRAMAEETMHTRMSSRLPSWRLCGSMSLEPKTTWMFLGRRSSGSQRSSSSAQTSRIDAGQTMSTGQRSYAAMAARACGVLPQPISSAIRQRPPSCIARLTPSRWKGFRAASRGALRSARSSSREASAEARGSGGKRGGGRPGPDGSPAKSPAKAAQSRPPPSARGTREANASTSHSHRARPLGPRLLLSASQSSTAVLGAASCGRPSAEPC
mmetsp:Transcript_57944/g.172354  ORF Transcript_57944/g.172354 Transcript_57944/m.172354 type:complete len:242 (-) Transcript_57944:26-751(-)